VRSSASAAAERWACSPRSQAPPSSVLARRILDGDVRATTVGVRVNKTARERFPRISKNRAVYRYREFVGTVLGWEPDRFMYRAGPVPPGTGRTGPVPTGFANPGGSTTLGTGSPTAAGRANDHARSRRRRHCLGEPWCRRGAWGALVGSLSR
jgi:hypothetical protein